MQIFKIYFDDREPVIITERNYVMTLHRIYEERDIDALAIIANADVHPLITHYAEYLIELFNMLY